MQENKIKKAVVTGGAGFIGSNMVDRLVDMGVQVTVIDNLSTGKRENINSAAYFWEQDLVTAEVETISEYLEDVDAVFHFAAMARVQPSIEDPVMFNENNVTATLKLLKACADSKVKRFVLSSSSSIYGDAEVMPTSEELPRNPMSPYAAQKMICEDYCKLFSDVYGLDTVCLRYFNVYGDRMTREGAYCTVLGIWAGQVEEGKNITITNDGEQRRDFTYVGDVVNANLLSATHTDKLNGGVYNVGNSDNVTINELAVLFEHHTNSHVEYIGDRLEPKATLADISKIKNKLGWKPNGDVKKWVKNFVKELKHGSEKTTTKTVELEYELWDMVSYGHGEPLVPFSLICRDERFEIIYMKFLDKIKTSPCIITTKNN